VLWSHYSTSTTGGNRCLTGPVNYCQAGCHQHQWHVGYNHRKTESEQKMAKILFGVILGVAITHFGIVPIAQFIDRTYDSTVQLVATVTKR